MGQIHIILGMPENASSAEPAVLHCSRDGDKARAALAAAMGPGGWPVVEHLRGVRGYRKQGVAAEPPVFVPAGKELDEAISANHSLKGEINLLDIIIAEQKAQIDKDAASLAEMMQANDALLTEVRELRTQHHQANELIDDKERATEEMKRNRDEVQQRLDHATARITFLEKELSSSAPNAAPQVPAADAPKGDGQQQAKGKGGK